MGDSSGGKAYVNRLLMALNVLAFLYLEIAGSSEDAYFMYTKGAMLAPAVLEGGQYYRLFTALCMHFENGQWYRILTSMFMHFGINHLINNMLVLFVMGEPLERALGHGRYLILYLTSGIGANIISMLLREPDSMVISAGASGAIFGVIGGLLYLVIANKGKMEDLSTRQLVIMIAFSLYFGYTSTGVDNTAHISGLIFGFLLGMLLYRRPIGHKKWRVDDYEKR